MSGREESTRASVSLSFGPGVWITCNSYEDRLPILSIYDGSVSVSLSPGRSGSAAGHDLATAKELLRAVQTYAAECERILTASVPPVAA